MWSQLQLNFFFCQQLRNVLQCRDYGDIKIFTITFSRHNLRQKKNRSNAHRWLWKAGNPSWSQTGHDVQTSPIHLAFASHQDFWAAWRVGLLRASLGVQSPFPLRMKPKAAGPVLYCWDTSQHQGLLCRSWGSMDGLQIFCCPVFMYCWYTYTAAAVWASGLWQAILTEQRISTQCNTPKEFSHLCLLFIISLYLHSHFAPITFKPEGALSLPWHSLCPKRKES